MKKIPPRGGSLAAFLLSKFWIMLGVGVLQKTDKTILAFVVISSDDIVVFQVKIKMSSDVAFWAGLYP